MSFRIFTLSLFLLTNISHASPAINPDQQDIQEVQDLIRGMLNWVESERFYDIVPAIKGEGDSIYVSVDQVKYQQNVADLNASGFFGPQFLATYAQIIQTIDQKLKDNSFKNGRWYVGYYPPFTLSGDANPWCNCQEEPSTDTWDKIEIEQISGNTYAWRWGGIKDNTYGWAEFRYEFKVEKVNGQWKIAQLQGFDPSVIE